MTPPLFLLDSLPDGDVVVLDGDEGRHAVTVKRLTAGEEVLVGDGAGHLLTGVVRSAVDGRLVLDVVSRRVEPPALPRLVVVQALPKGERAELAVELLTELGVDEIVPWSAERSIAQWRDARGAKALQRWRRTAREAAKQSRRAWVPEVAELASTGQVAARIAGSRSATAVPVTVPATVPVTVPVKVPAKVPLTVASFVLHEAAPATLAGAVLPSAGELLLVVGPEGGISDAELACFADAGANAVRLGSPVMRTSTAGAAALAALSVLLDRWR
ncbi:MAG TPA: 16S rRNA (uracil(1498)-N(3))-methyltransferase [Jatrophihabitantaceae bacterium]|nr:16S rRNA (uracil(1498)-N(3))-methyltransferase [Jatrophihabitantaceae bacterium]